MVQMVNHSINRFIRPMGVFIEVLHNRMSHNKKGIQNFVNQRGKRFLSVKYVLSFTKSIYKF